VQELQRYSSFSSQYTNFITVRILCQPITFHLAGYLFLSHTGEIPVF